MKVIQSIYFGSNAKEHIKKKNLPFVLKIWTLDGYEYHSFSFKKDCERFKRDMKNAGWAHLLQQIKPMVKK